MKFIALLISLSLCTHVLAQSPRSFKYQAVVRNTNGLPLVEKTIQVKVSILESSIGGVVVFSELHTVTTTTLGIVNLEIGRGTAVISTLASVDWGKKEHFIKIEMDPNGGTNFELVGTSQLLSVPYSLYAEKSGDEKWAPVSGGINYPNGRVGIGSTDSNANLSIGGINSNFQIHKLEIKSTESAGKGRFEFKGDVADTGNGYLTALDRFGDTSEDLIFGLQQPIGNTTSWNILESWRGAGLLLSSSGTEGKPLLFGIDRVEKMRLDASGNLGIGRSPNYKLDVEGTINASEIRINGLPLPSGNSLWSQNANDIYFNTGRVGIGTTTPTAQLAIAGINSNFQIHKLEIKSTESAGKGRFEFKGDVADTGNGYMTALDRFGDTSEDLIFGLQQPIGNTTSWNILESWRGAGLLLSSSGTEGKPLLFGIDRVEKMRLDASGNLGIGTTEPKSKLQVESGDVYLSTVGAGVIMKSPNGQCWRMTVDNAGAPVLTSITCP